MRPLRASRAFARAGAPAPAPAPAQSQGTLGLVLDILGHAISIVITLASIPRIWRLRKMPITVDHSLLVPLLSIPDRGLAARRVQSWLFASVFHSLTLILQKHKFFGDEDLWSLLFTCPGPLFALIISAVLLLILLRHYPISEDPFITSVIIGFGFIGYVLFVLTNMIYLQSTVALEIILVPITICVQTLRFTSQDTPTQFEVIPFTVAAIGVVSGTLVLIPPRSGFWEHLMPHLALNIAALVGAAFRLVDVLSICFPATATGDAIDYFRSRLQECFV